MPVVTTAATPINPKIPAPLGRVAPPNDGCRELLNNTAAWEAYARTQPPYNAAFSPYANMPPGGRELQQIAALPFLSYPNPPDGSDQLVLSVTAPLGYDGIITKVVNMFTGTGFVEGSGGIAWRVKIGNKYARNLGNILFTYGSLTDPFVIPGVGVPIVSGQTLRYLVNIPAISPVGGQNAQIICAVFGWFYPRKGQY